MSSWFGPWFDNWFGGWFGSTGIVVDDSVDTPAERTRAVPAENRYLSVPSENRALAVPAENRYILLHEEPLGGKIVKFPFKDPDEIKDYKLKYEKLLTPDSDTLYDSIWTIVTSATDETELDQSESDNPLVIVTQTISNESLHSKLWLAGGVVGTTYFLLNRVVTVAGRHMDQTVSISIKQR